jgi:NAD(P)-dependent dehydrogenase (short-subunit alcohol dehydrogenase family)
MSDAAARVALVSGGNRGLGLEVVRQLAPLGWEVILGARDPKKGETARRSLRAQSVTVMPLDVTDPEAAPRVAAAIRSRYGRCDALINNAAVHYDDWETATGADFRIVREAFEANVLGAWRLAAAQVPLMRAQRVAVRSRKGRQVSSGRRRCRTMDRPVGSSGTAFRCPGSVAARPAHCPAAPRD